MAAVAGRQDLGQLIAATLPEPVVFGLIGGQLLIDDRLRELLIAQRAIAAGVARDLRAVNGDHADRRQPRVRAQRQDLAEQRTQRLLMAINEPRDGGVIGALMGGDDATRDVFYARALKRARRAHTTRPAVQQQRDHHRRLIRGAPASVSAVCRIKRVDVHHRHRVDDKPRQVIIRQPIADIRRHQKRLITITRDEVLSHGAIVLNPPDST